MTSPVIDLPPVTLTLRLPPLFGLRLRIVGLLLAIVQRIGIADVKTETNYMPDANLSTIKLGPGDVLVASMKGRITFDTEEHVRDQMRNAFGADAKVLVHDEGMTVGVIKRHDDADLNMRGVGDIR